MTYANKTLRAKYMLKAINIGSNATKLVNDFFDDGIKDRLNCCWHFKWTLTDLDRALDEMGKQKKPRISRAFYFAKGYFLAVVFVATSSAIPRLTKASACF